MEPPKFVGVLCDCAAGMPPRPLNESGTLVPPLRSRLENFLGFGV
jgi:hypothetical protein